MTESTTSNLEGDLILVEHARDGGQTTRSEDSVSSDNCDLGTERQVGGAAVAGGIAGLVLGGPILALVAAGGAAVVATSSRGKPGDVVRQCGDATADAGHRLKRYDEEHRVVERATHSIKVAWKGISKTFNKPQPRNPGTSLTE